MCGLAWYIAKNDGIRVNPNRRGGMSHISIAWPFGGEVVIFCCISVHPSPRGTPPMRLIANISSRSLCRHESDGVCCANSSGVYHRAVMNNPFSKTSDSIISSNVSVVGVFQVLIYKKLFARWISPSV